MIDTNPIRLYWAALRILYEDLFQWVAFSALTWVGLVLVIPFFPAVAALHEMALIAIDGRALRSAVFWKHLRAWFRKALLLGLVVGVVTAVLAANVRFYDQHAWGVLRYATIFWLWTLIVWCMSAVYVYPLLVLQEETQVWLIVRNALFLALGRPVHTLVATVLLLSTTLVTAALPILLLLLPAFWAVYTTLLTQQLVLAIKRRHEGGPEGNTPAE